MNIPETLAFLAELDRLQCENRDLPPSSPSLTIHQLMVLIKVVQKPGVTAGEASSSTRSVAAMTLSADALERRGLVECRKDPNDRRKRLLYPTQRTLNLFRNQ